MLDGPSGTGQKGFQRTTVMMDTKGLPIVIDAPKGPLAAFTIFQGIVGIDNTLRGMVIVQIEKALSRNNLGDGPMRSIAQGKKGIQRKVISMF